MATDDRKFCIVLSKSNLYSFGKTEQLQYMPKSKNSAQ